MLILIDRISLRMIASASNHKLMGLVAKWDFPDADALVVDSEIGREWTALNELDMKNLYLNMSGQPADAYPGYQAAIEQLRQYAGMWTEYPKPLSYFEGLENMCERQSHPHNGAVNSEGEPIVGEPVATDNDEPVGNSADGEDETVDPKELVKRARANHQAIITGVEKANAAMTPEQKEAAKASAPTKPEKEKSSEPSAPRKPGATKMVWDIADARHSANPGLDLKALRKLIVAECESQGINAGTAATQFGKWKASKGL